MMWPNSYVAYIPTELTKRNGSLFQHIRIMRAIERNLTDLLCRKYLHEKNCERLNRNSSGFMIVEPVLWSAIVAM